MALNTLTRSSFSQTRFYLQIRRSSSAVIPPVSVVPRPLEQLPTTALLRTIFLSRVFASPIISRFGISLLSRLADSRQPLLNPDKNPVLRRVLRALIYDHFCAGSESDDIRDTVARIKKVGYKGVILNYAREIIAHDLNDLDSTANISSTQIQQWLDGNMKTLSCIGPGDYLGIKYTGAGTSIADALVAQKAPPREFSDALETLCQHAKSQGSYVLVDAEQQVYQPTIDRWTVDLMRKYNRDGDALILNTYQAYLKATRANLFEHMRQAQREGWILGIKLVRGAYILQEQRSRIHDTKEDTDKAYDTIAHDLLARSFDEVTRENFPQFKLFLAGHNATSIRNAAQLHKELVLRGLEPGPLEFGQLYGMADHISGELLATLAADEQMTGLTKEQITSRRNATPQVFKCVNWGSVQECLNFLIRRAAENQGAAERLQDGLVEAKKELQTRIFGPKGAGHR